jgi:xanthine/uracil permease
MTTKRLPRKSHFYNKLIKSIALGTLFLIVSLAIGVWGYHYFFNISWLDSLVNASMILTGMGPVDRAETDGAKWFSSLYAIYSGVAFLTSVAVIFGPIVHRFLHKFRIDVEEE